MNGYSSSALLSSCKRMGYPIPRSSPLRYLQYRGEIRNEGTLRVKSQVAYSNMRPYTVELLGKRLSRNLISTQGYKSSIGRPPAQNHHSHRRFNNCTPLAIPQKKIRCTKNHPKHTSNMRHFSPFPFITGRKRLRVIFLQNILFQ